MMKTRFPIRTLAGMFGVLLLVLLVRRVGIANLRESIAAVGWRLVLVIALGGVGHIVKTWAWRLTLLDDKREVSFARTLGLRLASEAVGQLGFLGQMFGENLRVLFLSSTIPLANGIASVTLDRAFFILSGVVVSAVGLVARDSRMSAAPCPLAICRAVRINIPGCHSSSGASGARALACSFRSCGDPGPHPVSAWLD